MLKRKIKEMTMRLISIVVIVFCMNAHAMAKDYKVGSIEISTPWSRTTPKGAQTGVGYMSIKNNGTTPDRLIGGSIEVADHFQLHSMAIENGIAKMRELSDIEIKPGQTIEFKPSGSHVMFVNLKRPLSKGEHVSGTLVFERAGKVNVEYSVESIGAQTGPQQMEHMHH